MLTRFISAFVHSQRPLTTISPRLFNTSVPKLGDGDHTHSHGKYKAYDDLKSGQEKRWLDTVASDSGKKSLNSSSLQIYVYYRSSSKKRKRKNYGTC
jgi:hypothetical protein